MAVVRAGLHGTVAQSSAQVIDGSLLFQKTSIITPLAPDYALTWEPSYAASLQKNTISGWFQRSNIEGTQTLFSTCQDSTSSDYFEISLYNDQLKVHNRSDSQNSANPVDVVTNYKFRDFSGWYHFVVALDSTLATASDRVKIYINGIRQLDLDAQPFEFPSLNYNFHFPSSTATSPSWDIGRSVYGGGSAGSGQYFGGYASQFYFIDGQALDESYFGYTDPLTNTWRPKKFSGSYSLNTDGYNTTWSDYLTTNGTMQNAHYAFDGDMSTRAQTANNAAGKTLTFSPPDINFTTSLEVYCDQGATGPAPMPTASWDGNSVEPGQGAWVTVYSGSGTLGSAKPLVIDTNSASQYATLKGVRIDGTVLVDVDGLNSFYLPFDGNLPIVEDQSGNGNDFTQFNFGSSNVIPKATGALPILNTVNGGKVATAGVRKDVGPNTPAIIKDSGCVSFDGSWDALRVTHTADYDFGSGDFTMEAYVYLRAYTNANAIVCKSGDDNNNPALGPWSWTANNVGSSQYHSFTWHLADNGGSFTINSSTAISLNTWTYCAVVREGNDVRLYQDGIQVGHNTMNPGSNPLLNTTVDITIGDEDNSVNNHDMNGLISNVRIVKGSCLYPNGTTFKPPTEPLINVTNTTLLCCQSSTSKAEAAVGGTNGYINAAGDVYATASEVSSACVLALPMVGIKSDFSHQINSGSTEKEMNTGNPVTIDNSQKDNFYGGSFIFDGTTGGGGSDYLYANSNSDFDFGGGDYTIEWWSFWSDAPGQGFHQSIFDCGYTQADSLLIQSEGNDSTKWIVYAQGDTVLTETTPSPLQRWTHYALVRNGTSMKLYRNGSVSGSGTHTGTTHGSSNYAFSIGYEPTNNGRVFNGYIQDFRIYKGVAKYTDNFIPASVNPTIFPNTSSGVSLGSQLTKIIDGAVGFDDPNYPTFLTFSPSSNFDFDQHEFTIEGFFNKSTSNASLTLLCSENYHTSGYNGNWILRITDNTQIAFASYDGQGNGEYVEFPCENVVGVWYHFAFVRDGNGQAKFYLNGKLCGSMTLNKSLTDAGTYGLRIGYESAGGPGNGTYHGFLSNIRIIKGTELYTADFIPPTEPLTNVTNTKLLCCQSNTSVTDAAVGGSVTPWIPSGFTYWTDGMSANWNGSGNTTSGSNDYISIALPQSGKYYWETIINDPGTYRILGISSGAAGAGTGYTDDIFGYYYNNPIPLYLTRNAGGTTRGSGDNGGAGIATHGNYNPFQWEAGKKLMWALDADNDKIWFGYEGSWVQSADPANGTNPTILGEDLSAYDFHFKLGYNNGGGNLTLTNVASGDAGSTIDPTVNGVGLSATNFNPFADDINTVMGQETSYCTWDPIAVNNDYTSTYTISNGNLDFTTIDSPNLSGYGSVGVTSGKWYWEVVHTVFANADFDAATYVSFSFPYRTPRDKGIGYMTDGKKRINDSISGYGTSYAVGDVIGIALDADQNTVTYYKDGKSQGPIEFVSSGSTNFSVSRPQDFTSFRPSIHQVNGTDNLTGSGNFGQKPFKYTPPEGHQPLNYANLQSPEVVRPDQYVGITTWTGDATSPRSFSSLPFKPDFVWIKDRSASWWHTLYDSVRGAGTKAIYSNTLDAEDGGASAYGSQYGYLSSFDGNGFTLTTGTSDLWTNDDGDDYVGWCWKAGGNKNTFNVDDLGYASASDVNMGISDLNSTYYNQDQDWSGTLGSDAAFDNDFSSVGVPVGTTYVDLTDKPFSVSSIISVWIHDPGANNPVYIKYNGVEYSNTNPTIYGWTDFTVPAGTNNAGNSGALQVKLHASNDNCRGVKVDGRILVDNTITITLPSIAPTGCSVGTKQGFSIVSWTGNATEGATLAHGLKKAPSFVIVKNLDDDGTYGQADEGRWMVWHKFYSGKQYITLENDDLLNIETGASTPWGNTIPASSYITLGSYNPTNGSGDKMISYMWHDVPGLQKFGFYKGNNDSNGPFIDLGFSPAILLIKGLSSNGTAWVLYDNVRDPGNPSFRWLRPNDSNIENTDTTADNIDFLSNGFKLRNSGNSAPNQVWTNNSNNYYIYAAWAYQPMNNLYGGQSNAR